MHKFNDYIKVIDGSIIQHDNMNNRVYLMKVNENNYINIIEKAEKIAKLEKYTKIIGKVPFSAKSFFLKNDYCIEAIVPNLYKNDEEGLFVAKYFSEDREKEKFKEITEDVLKTIYKKDKKNKQIILPEGFIYREAKKEDAKLISNFYKGIFKTYPFPIYNESYILKVMNDNVIYFTIWKNDKLISIASTEIDYENYNVEMTDFGTHPDYRGNGFASFLLVKMEEKMIKNEINMAYTIARSKSYGMNDVFFQNGYLFAGKLTNNTNISGEIESMNVWYKKLI